MSLLHKSLIIKALDGAAQGVGHRKVNVKARRSGYQPY
jgi:hypothetical protein